MHREKTACQTLLDWWQAKRGARPMPTRAELDPAEIKSILPYLVLIDVKPGSIPDAHTFVCRLAGTEIDHRLGTRVTSLSLDQVPLGDARESIRRQYETAVREARPIFCSHNLVVNDERYVEYERLAVPLAGEPPAGDPARAGSDIVALAAALDFKCAYLLSRGRPPDCRGGTYCDRIDLCTMPPPIDDVF